MCTTQQTSISETKLQLLMWHLEDAQLKLTQITR